MADDRTDLPPEERLTVLRVLDANANRAAEGLRVVEEYFRLGRGDTMLARTCKELRHELADILAEIPAFELTRARDTLRDVGTGISTPAENQRRSLAEVTTANWKRVEQALRAIEEYGKLVPPLDVSRLEKLRYRVYTLGKAITIEQSSQLRLRDARLYVLVDGGGAAETFNENEYRRRVQGLVSAGVHLLQLRDKTLDDRTLLKRAIILREITRGSGTLLIVNDRADLASAARADGVHLGQEDLPIYEARQIVGTQALIGVSTHSIEQARQAVLDGADYIGCGPTFPSATKQFQRLAGLEFLRQVAAEITLPSFAIGGITPENLPQVLETGMTRVAISGAVWQADEPRSIVSRIHAQFARPQGTYS
ncbi:MAG TPA: thiamine phosphate synthase [Pirellulaceae bacterium]|nr:thiamine phosphate synthase [Pirellulaceae bacterium]